MISQLRTLAREVRDYQIERDWSDARLCREIAHLGSVKTFKRILDPGDELDGLSVENQLRNYHAARETVSRLRATDRPAEPEYADFTNILNAKGAVARAMLEEKENVSRLVIIEGPTGAGKDAVRRHLEKSWEKIVVSVEATEMWRDSLAVPAREIHAALCIVKQRDRDTQQLPKPPRFPAEIVAEIIGYLNERKLILIINEAHHLGPRGLNMVKTLINQTPAIVVLECIPALLTRLLSHSHEEAVQLTGNRLFERVYLPSPAGGEISELIKRRGVTFAGSDIAATAAAMISNHAPNYGNWRFVNQVVRKLYESPRRAAIDGKTLDKAVSDVIAMRTRIVRAGS